MAKRKQPGLYPTPQKKAEWELRRYQMLELYKGGATEKQIGETLGVDKSQVHRPGGGPRLWPATRPRPRW